MRRLPVYLVLDTSASMYGEAIEAVKNGVQTLLSTLRQDPYALETAFISVITFNTKAEQVAPLTDLITFKVPYISAEGVTALGDALSLVSSCIQSEVVKASEDKKGDWKPLVFIMTDGAPTDDWQQGLNQFKQVSKGLVIACAAGGHADTDVLKQITDTVLQLDTADSSTIQAFFKWVSASVSMGSQKVESNNRELSGIEDLPPPPSEVNIVL